MSEGKKHKQKRNFYVFFLLLLLFLVLLCQIGLWTQTSVAAGPKADRLPIVLQPGERADYSADPRATVPFINPEIINDLIQQDVQDPGDELTEEDRILTLTAVLQTPVPTQTSTGPGDGPSPTLTPTPLETAKNSPSPSPSASLAASPSATPQISPTAYSGDNDQ